jgi:hypothetical protein
MSDSEAVAVPNGPAAGAVLAASVGWFVLGALALAGDAVPRVARLLTFWKPTGPLSGVTTTAIVIWLLAWLLLGRRWRSRDVNMRGVGTVAAVLTLAGLLLTFPPFMDLLQGK